MRSLDVLKTVTLLVILVIAIPAASVLAEPYPPGDANGDYLVDVDDVVYLIGYIFSSGPGPVSMASADVVFDCTVDIDDVVNILTYIFTSGAPELTYGCSHEDSQSECSESPGGYGEPGYMVVEVLGNDIRIHHFDAFYQCCLLYTVDFAIVGMNITAVESDTGEYCYCDCFFHLESTLYDLNEGEYIVTLIGIYGDTVGTDTVTIDPEYGLVTYSQSGCFEEPTVPEDTNITYYYSSDTLTMMHHDAFFNCGAQIIIDFEQAADTLRFYEIAYFEVGATYCMCYFELSAAAYGIPPGEYVAEVYDKQYPWTPTELVDRRILQLGVE